MPRPELRLAVLGAALLAGCAWQPLHVHADTAVVGQYEYLARALLSDGATRESLWQQARQQPGLEAALHRALLRSVPGHSGYDLGAADAELQALLIQNPSSELAPVARARLEDLRSARACRAEVETLKRRMAKVVDIERRQDQNRR